MKREPQFMMTVKTNEINVDSATKNTGIGYDLPSDMYRYRESAGHSSSTPPIPKGGYTNEVLYNKLCSVDEKLDRHHRSIS